MFSLIFLAKQRREFSDSNEFIQKCIEKSNDPAKCQLKAFAFFGKIKYVGKEGKNKDISEINAIKNMLRLEEIKKQAENEDNNWISDDSSNVFYENKKRKRDKNKIKTKITETYENSDIICDKPNSVPMGGKCVCSEDHPFGDPSKTGCWGCSIPCASGALCISQDFCRCPDFYIGDGIRNCTIHVPTIISVKGRISDSVAVVLIDEVPWKIPNHAFCKIDNEVTNGTLVSKNRIECKSRAMIHSKAKVLVSWDRSTWSIESKKLYFDGVPHIFSVWNFLVVLLLTSIASWFALKYYRKFSRINYKEGDLFDLAFKI